MWDWQLCLGQWQWRGKGWRQPQEVQWGKKESRRTSETPPGTWLSRTEIGSLWLCYAGPLAEKRKSGISGKWCKLKLIPWGEEQFGKLGEEEGEPVI